MDDGMKTATIKDIAKAVGVSPTTVSNVIHGNTGRVSPDMIARIQRAIQEMRYTPNLSARSLVSSASRIIGVIYHQIPLEYGGFFQDPFHGAVLAGIEQTLRQNNYYMMVRTIDDVPELQQFLTNWNLDGLILTGIFPTEFYRSLAGQPIPFLLIDSYIDNPKILQVRLEDRGGGYLGTRFLLEKGHRRILFCGPAMKDSGVIAERYAGYRQALAEFGVEHRPEDLCEQEIGVQQGTELGRRLAGRQDFTAIFATADILAAGLISGLSEGGRRVPGDISIVGFDDLNIARLTSPQLTTVRQDVVRKGVLAVELMVSALKNGTVEHEPVVMPVEMVERQSVRAI